jgi:hypothetical protein
MDGKRDGQLIGGSAGEMSAIRHVLQMTALIAVYSSIRIAIHNILLECNLSKNLQNENLMAIRLLHKL